MINSLEDRRGSAGSMRVRIRGDSVTPNVAGLADVTR